MRTIWGYANKMTDFQSNSDESDDDSDVVSVMREKRSISGGDDDGTESESRSPSPRKQSRSRSHSDNSIVQHRVAQFDAHVPIIDDNPAVVKTLLSYAYRMDAVNLSLRENLLSMIEVAKRVDDLIDSTGVSLLDNCGGIKNLLLVQCAPGEMSANLHTLAVLVKHNMSCGIKTLEAIQKAVIQTL